MNDDAQSGARLGRAMREAVYNQLEANDPPAVTEAFMRLQTQGVSKDEAIRMMAHCMTIITFDMLKHNRPFDPARYERMLATLPDEEAIYKL